MLNYLGKKLIETLGTLLAIATIIFFLVRLMPEEGYFEADIRDKAKVEECIKDLMSKGKLSAAHGRTLAAIANEEAAIVLAEKIAKEGISVREAEKLAASEGKSRKKKQAPKKEKNADILKVEDDLKNSLGTRVAILPNGNKGKIEIEYYSKDELERLIELLKTLG